MVAVARTASPRGARRVDPERASGSRSSAPAAVLALAVGLGAGTSRATIGRAGRRRPRRGAGCSRCPSACRRRGARQARRARGTGRRHVQRGHGGREGASGRPGRRPRRSGDMRRATAGAPHRRSSSRRCVERGRHCSRCRRPAPDVVHQLARPTGEPGVRRALRAAVRLSEPVMPIAASSLAGACRGDVRRAHDARDSSPSDARSGSKSLERTIAPCGEPVPASGRRARAARIARRPRFVPRRRMLATVAADCVVQPYGSRCRSASVPGRGRRAMCPGHVGLGPELRIATSGASRSRVAAGPRRRVRRHPHGARLPPRSARLDSGRRSRSRAAFRRRSACRSRSSPSARGQRSRATARTILSYGPASGYEPLRDWIAERHGVDPGRVLVTNGGAPGLRLPRAALRAAAAASLVEAPTYDRPLKILRELGAEIVPLPMDDDGLDADALEAALAAGRSPRSSTRSRPSRTRAGATLSTERRRRIVELARRARPARARGRPVRARPLRGRAAAVAARARRRRARRLHVVVLEDGRARASASATSSCPPDARAPSSRRRRRPTYITPGLLGAGDRPRVHPARPLRAEPRAGLRPARARAATRCSRRSTRSSAAGATLDPARGRLLRLARRCPGVDTAELLGRRPASRCPGVDVRRRGAGLRRRAVDRAARVQLRLAGRDPRGRRAASRAAFRCGGALAARAAARRPARSRG